jgi:hypothetical protein
MASSRGVGCFFRFCVTLSRLGVEVDGPDRRCIPRSIAVLCDFHESNVERIAFESKSRLRRVKDDCFLNGGIKSMLIPRRVTMLGELGFCESHLETSAFEPGSERAQIAEYCWDQSPSH